MKDYSWVEMGEDVMVGSRLWNSPCTLPQFQRWLLFGTASKLTSFPDHFLPNCFWFL